MTRLTTTLPAPLRPYIGYPEQQALLHALNSEEGAAIDAMLAALNATLESMPRTFQTDGQGDAAVIHLHYFHGASHWYITELDSEGGRAQAFGFVVLNGDMQNAEAGYISIDELVLLAVELDLYWTKRTLGALKLELLP